MMFDDDDDDVDDCMLHQAHFVCHRVDALMPHLRPGFLTNLLPMFGLTSSLAVPMFGLSSSLD
jgi:hypothetical protein